MAEHLTLVTLRRALSSRAGVSEKVADDFLNALIGSIQEGLKTDGQVAISGLGTFQVQDVPARESVNVVTGERITIKGFKKVVFTASQQHGTAVAEKGKRSAAKAKAEVPVDPIEKLGEQAEEIKDILSELNAMPTDGAAQEGAAVTVPIEIPEIPQAPREPEPVVPQEPQQPEPIVSPEPQKPVYPVSPEPQKPEEKEKEKKPFNAWLTGLITIGVFAMLLIIAYFILRNQIVNWADHLRANIEQRVSTPEDHYVQPAQPAEQPEEVAPEPQPEVRQLPDYYDDSKRKFTQFQATETVGQDSRLAWVAKKHYNEKAMWVFIYEANRDRVKDPNLVLPGTKLRIPKLPADLRDVNNPDTKALLDRLSDKYLNL